MQGRGWSKGRLSAVARHMATKALKVTSSMLRRLLTLKRGRVGKTAALYEAAGGIALPRGVDGCRKAGCRYIAGRRTASQQTDWLHERRTCAQLFIAISSPPEAIESGNKT